jgi:predicted protein tyrosine phosphatase
MKGNIKKRNLRLRLKKLTIQKEPSIESPTAPKTFFKKSSDEMKLFQITPQLFVSGYNNAQNLECLKQHGITHVINLTAHHCPNLHHGEVGYSSFSISDNAHFDLFSFFESLVDLISQKINENHRVLVHCKMGISRAPSVVMAFLIRKMQMSYSCAFDYVQKIHPKVSPNLGFLMQLKKLEELTLN